MKINTKFAQINHADIMCRYIAHTNHADKSHNCLKLLKTNVKGAKGQRFHAFLRRVARREACLALEPVYSNQHSRPYNGVEASEHLLYA